MSFSARLPVLAFAILAGPAAAHPQDAGYQRPVSTIEAPLAQASLDSFQALVRPSLEVRRAQGPITLDGELDDPGWEGAARTDHFSETFPTERGRPPVESEVWVT